MPAAMKSVIRAFVSAVVVLVDADPLQSALVLVSVEGHGVRVLNQKSVAVPGHVMDVMERTPPRSRLVLFQKLGQVCSKESTAVVDKTSL